MIRIVRIFRLFRINAYYDSLNVITEVISGKKQQLISSVFIIVILMLASSLCMYSLEHEAQPEVFANAFSGIWWAASTLLTVGYGDIVLQEKDSIVLGAEPFGEHEKINLKEIVLKPQNPWTGMRIRDLDISRHTIIVLVKRRNKALILNGNMILTEGDRVFLYTQQHLLDVNEIEI